MDRGAPFASQLIALSPRDVLRLVRMQRRLVASDDELSRRLGRYCSSVLTVLDVAAVSISYRSASAGMVYASRVRPFSGHRIEVGRLRSWFESSCRQDEVEHRPIPRAATLSAERETIDPTLVGELIVHGFDMFAVVARGHAPDGQVIGRALFRSSDQPSQAALQAFRLLLPSAATLEPRGRTVPLDPPEQRTLRLVLGGHSEKEIAKKLQTSHGSIHHRLKKLYRSYSVSSRAELLALFVDRQLLRRLSDPSAAPSAGASLGS